MFKLVLKSFLIIMLLFAGVASATGELPFKRMLYVNEWGGTTDTPQNVDRIINDSSYIKADAIYIRVPSQYVEAARDPVNKGSWDSRAGNVFYGKPMLEYVIQQAHAKGIQVHAWIGVNSIGDTKRAEYRLFGPSAGYPYNQVNQNGVKSTNFTYRIDMTFKEYQDYEVNLLTWVAKHYPQLDGIHIEEPLYYQYSYSTAVRNRVTAKFGYDPMSPPPGKNRSQIQIDITNVQRDGWNEFFTKLKTSINANKSNQNLLLSINSWEYVFDADGKEGLDVSYLVRNNLIDFFVMQSTGADSTGYSLAGWKKQINGLSTTITTIPVVAIAYVSSSGMGKNTDVFNEIKYSCDYGADAAAIFAWHWLKEYTGGYINDTNIMDAFHNMPPCQAYISPPNISNYINNSGFESGTTLWTLYSNGTGTFTSSSPGFAGTKAANLILNNGGTNIQLYQTGITLEPNTVYRLSFSAYSTSGNDLTVRLFKHISPNTVYMPDFRANLSTSWQTFTTEFTSRGFNNTVNDGRFQFWLSPFAQAGDTYIIDDIRLTKVNVTENKYDINNDGIVNVYDIIVVYYHINEITTSPYPKYDVNKDGKVDIYDMVLVSKNII